MGHCSSIIVCNKIRKTQSEHLKIVCRNLNCLLKILSKFHFFTGNLNSGLSYNTTSVLKRNFKDFLNHDFFVEICCLFKRSKFMNVN